MLYNLGCCTSENESHLEEDEQLARALQESLNVESPPHENGHNYHPLPFVFSSGFRYLFLNFIC